MDKFAHYAPIIVQGLMTILIANHWLRGLEVSHLIVFWVILLGLSISPILDIIYGNTYDERICHQCNSYINDEMLNIGSYKCENCFDSGYDSYLNDYSPYDQCDLLPHSEEMEEEYQPNE